eukprot:1179870-Prorocentrum_minimum.AAC.3
MPHADVMPALTQTASRCIPPRTSCYPCTAPLPPRPPRTSTTAPLVTTTTSPTHRYPLRCHSERYGIHSRRLTHVHPRPSCHDDYEQHGGAHWLRAWSCSNTRDELDGCCRFVSAVLPLLENGTTEEHGWPVRRCAYKATCVRARRPCPS